MTQNTRQVIADRVRQAFLDLKVVRGPRHADKYETHFEAIANYLLSAPGTDEYKFVRSLITCLKNRGCVLVTPAMCSNRDRMVEAMEAIGRPLPTDPEQMVDAYRRHVSACISNGVCETLHNVFVSPVSNLPAWFRVTESGHDPEVVRYYGEEAEEELAKDPVLAEYVRGRENKK